MSVFWRFPRGKTSSMSSVMPSAKPAFRRVGIWGMYQKLWNISNEPISWVDLTSWIKLWMRVQSRYVETCLCHWGYIWPIRSLHIPRSGHHWINIIDGKTRWSGPKPLSLDNSSLQSSVILKNILMPKLWTTFYLSSFRSKNSLSNPTWFHNFALPKRTKPTLASMDLQSFQYSSNHGRAPIHELSNSYSALTIPTIPDLPYSRITTVSLTRHCTTNITYTSTENPMVCSAAAKPFPWSPTTYSSNLWS